MRRIALACHGWRGLLGRSGLVLLLASAFALAAAAVGVAADVQGDRGSTSEDQGSAPAAPSETPPADQGSGATTPTPQPPVEPPQPAQPKPDEAQPEQPSPPESPPEEAAPDQSQSAAPGPDETAPAPQLEPLPEVGPAPAPTPAPLPVAQPAASKLAPVADPLAGLKAHRASSSSPVATKSQFPECQQVADPAACNQKLGELLDRQQAECPGAQSVGIGTTPGCRQAYRDYQTFHTCLAAANFEACAAEVAANPCFKDANSGPCLKFLDVDRVRNCKADFASLSFDCQVLLAANELYCTIGGGLRTEGNNVKPRCTAGGGSEEDNSPTGRTLPGGNQLATAGLVDPGARGDAGLQEVSVSSVKSKKPPKTTALSRTGLNLWPLVVFGLMLVAAGLLLRRRSAAAR